MIKKIALAAVVASAFSVPALAIDSSTRGLSPSSSSSWLGGAVAGYNWQRGPMVFGVEGDISGMDLKSVVTGVVGVSLMNTATATTDWYGTLRGRLGVSSGAWLFYGTGGLAFGEVKLNNTAYTTPNLISESTVVKAGWVAGAGIDYMVNKNLVVGVQYQYVDLGNVSLPGISAAGIGTPGIAPGSSVHAQFQAVTLSASWKFPAPPSASNAMASMHYKVKAPPPPVDPWAGAYAGAKVGGAQGNRETATPWVFNAF